MKIPTFYRLDFLKILYICLGFSFVSGFIDTTILSLSRGLTQEPPSFKVKGRDFTSLSILVPSNTTREQLKALIYALRNARKTNGFQQMNIPATTPKGKKGPYAIVMIFIFSEPEWASERNLKTFSKASNKDPYFQKYSKHIKAYYYYAAEPIGGPKNYEEGSIGYAEDGKVLTAIYEKLF